MSKPNGIILFEGKSKINGRAIVVIATGLKEKSNNSKTGNLVQTWILCKNISPQEAVRSNKDKAVCGDCKHRKFRSCYVNLIREPKHVWEAYKRGSYPKLDDNNLSYFKDRAIRIGSYGDPAAVPVEVWKQLLSVCSVHTGYTHQWKKCDNELKQICMASVDTKKEYITANHHGWRTFRTRLDTDEVFENEFVCPASKEGGRKTTCNNCKACNGINKMSKTPVIVAHGPTWKTSYYRRCIIPYRNKKRYKGLVKPVPNSIVSLPLKAIDNNDILQSTNEISSLPIADISPANQILVAIE